MSGYQAPWELDLIAAVKGAVKAKKRRKKPAIERGFSLFTSFVSRKFARLLLGNLELSAFAYLVGL